jgi:DNA-binding CsgD family transcriptional regulator
MWRGERGKISITNADVEGIPGLRREQLPIGAGNECALNLEATMSAPPITLASQLRTHSFNAPANAPAMAEVVAQNGICDLLGVNGRAERGRGVTFSFPLVAGERPTKRAAQVWSRLAVHLGTGLRLRDQQAAGREREPVAILSPSGRVLHAEPDAQGRTIREELSASARIVDRARGKLRRVDPDEAVSLWRALVRGEWSLVDRFDSDGRRFVVARRNAPVHETDVGALTTREARAAELLARGYANKLIAYELGLAPSTVAGLLASACRKLGAGSSLELVRLLRASHNYLEPRHEARVLARHPRDLDGRNRRTRKER